MVKKLAKQLNNKKPKLKVKEQQKEKKNPIASKDKNRQSKTKRNDQQRRDSFDEMILKEDNEQQISSEELEKKYNSCLKEVQESLIPEINNTQVKSAIETIRKLIKDRYKGTTNLLADINEEYLYLSFCFDKFPQRCSIRPVLIPLKHSIYGKDFNTSVCLFVKDPKSDFKDLNIEFPFKLKVIDISKLKLKYDRFEQRRNLLKQYDVFICDSRVYFLLRKRLGKPFYQAKKFPIGIGLDYEHPEALKEKIISQVESATFFHLTHGPNYSVKFSRVPMKNKESIDNGIEALTHTIPQIMKWDVALDELSSITIKGTNTVELPIYNHLKEDELMVWLEEEKNK